MTPQELHAAIDDRRRERELKWWQVAVAMDVSDCALRRMRNGAHSQAVAERAQRWLDRPASG